MANEYSDDETAVSTSTPSPKETGESESTTQAEAPVGVGPLLEKEPADVVKLMDGFWEDAEPYMAEPLARWKANRLRRKGVIGVHVVKPDPDKAEWKVWAPPGAARVPPTFNKPARLARRLVANLFVDKPLPEVTPGGASDNDKADAAEYQTRILQDVCTSRFFNVPEMAESAVDKACTYDSGFVRVYMDPRGNGSKPRTIIASEAARFVKDALYVDGDGETPQASPYVTRYVKALGEGIMDKELAELTDDPRLAELEFLPGLRRELLTGQNLRPIPATAVSIEDCQGVIIRTPAKMGDLRKQYPQIADLSLEEQWELVGQRPAKSDVVLNPADRAVARKKDEEKPPPDETTVIATMVYMAEGGSYPAGAYAVAVGTKTLLHRQKWEIEVNGVPESLPIPVAHFKGWDEGEDTFWGFHMMHFLGPGQEVRAAALGSAIEHIDRFNRRKVFYTPQTLYQPKIGPAAMGVMVPVQQGSEPKTEQFPDYPRIGMEILALSTAELDDESGLQPIAQGATDPSVTSGLHAQKVIEQVNIGLGTIKRNTDKGIERLWTIAAAMIRGYYTVPQQIRFRGDDQEYKQKDWSGVDLTDAKDVRLMKGSFTMLAPSAKLAVAEYMRKLNLIDDNQLRRMAAGNIGGLMGVQDDPALLRIRRQISLWEDGPPKAEHPSEPLPDQYPGETAIEEPQNAPGASPALDISPIGGNGREMPDVLGNPAINPAAAVPPGAPIVPGNGGIVSPEAQDPAIIGSIVPQTPPGPSPIELAGQNVFRALPNDEEPAIAGIRFQELSRAMCSKKFERQPEPWQQVFIAEYQRMRKAAGVGTAAEAAQNQQASADAQKKADQEKAATEIQGKIQIAQAQAGTKIQGDLQTIQAQTEGEMATKGATDLDLQTQKLEHDSIITDAKLESAEQVAKDRPAPAPPARAAGGRN